MRHGDKRQPYTNWFPPVHSWNAVRLNGSGWAQRRIQPEWRSLCELRMSKWILRCAQNDRENPILKTRSSSRKAAACDRPTPAPPVFSDSAPAGACASPAGVVSENGNYLIPEKLTRTSFYYSQRQYKAWKKPTREMVHWLRTCVRLTEEELQALYALEYPDWKPTNGEFGG